MSYVKNENYIVIQGFMINELKLKGNELLVYAIIYGFSQNEQKYSGSLQYLAEWTNSTKQGVIKNLQSLVNKGLIIKNDVTLNNVKFCEYYTTKFNGVLNKVERGIKQSLMGGIKQSLPNNIDINNIEDNKDIYKKEPKKAYGSYGRIKLSDTEYNKLINDYGQELIDNQINLLDEYVESNNNKNKYTNFNLVLRKSIRENWFNKGVTNGANKGNQLTGYEQFEQR